MPTDKPAQVEILLVEDNDDDFTWTHKALVGGGVTCNVRRAENGEEALDVLRKATQLPVLLLLDLSMPKKTGMEVLREIRGSDNPELKNIPVVILTASTSFGDAREAVNLKATAFISKPVKRDDLVKAVREILPDSDQEESKQRELRAWLDGIDC